MKFKPGYGLAAIGYMAGIFLLSSSQDDLVPASILMLKLLHLPLFGGLAACLLLSVTHGQWYRAVSWQVYGMIALVAGSYAAFDEWHQAFVPGRSASVSDFLLDCMAIALFLSLHRLISHQAHAHEDR